MAVPQREGGGRERKRYHWFISSDFSRPNSSSLVVHYFKLLQKSGRHQRNWKFYLMMEVMNLANSIHGFLVHLVRNSIGRSNMMRFLFPTLNFLKNREGYACKKIQFLYNAGRIHWSSFLFTQTHIAHLLSLFYLNSGWETQILSYSWCSDKKMWAHLVYFGSEYICTRSSYHYRSEDAQSLEYLNPLFDGLYIISWEN